MKFTFLAPQFGVGFNFNKKFDDSKIKIKTQRTEHAHKPKTKILKKCVTDPHDLQSEVCCSISHEINLDQLRSS